jgi:hypothetical protein
MQSRIRKREMRNQFTAIYESAFRYAKYRGRL